MAASTQRDYRCLAKRIGRLNVTGKQVGRAQAPGYHQLTANYEPV